MSSSSNFILQRVELIRSMIQLGETETLETQADRLRSTDGASALDEIADCLSNQRYSDAVVHIDDYIQSEAALQT